MKQHEPVYARKAQVQEDSANSGQLPRSVPHQIESIVAVSNTENAFLNPRLMKLPDKDLLIIRVVLDDENLYEAVLVSGCPYARPCSRVVVGRRVDAELHFINPDRVTDFLFPSGKSRREILLRGGYPKKPALSIHMASDQIKRGSETNV